ncbi:hypothetical protein PsorP6_002672 [Peronosclerospora sorghi]|uniref:Uncharacterized protein n=1 Tax=Peronosclerospora sorghi TaxID=230839 RepID=A0ACC0WQR3_9STRA|nr:hypothetical protein PsorP6_002672 [Peronosclerospora sorghi]
MCLTVPTKLLTPVLANPQLDKRLHQKRCARTTAPVRTRAEVKSANAHACAMLVLMVTSARKKFPMPAILIVARVVILTIILATLRAESASAALDILETHAEQPKTHVRNGHAVGLVRAKFWQTDPQLAFAHSAAQHAPFAT